MTHEPQPSRCFTAFGGGLLLMLSVIGLLLQAGSWQANAGSEVEEKCCSTVGACCCLEPTSTRGQTCVSNSSAECLCRAPSAPAERVPAIPAPTSTGKAFGVTPQIPAACVRPQPVAPRRAVAPSPECWLAHPRSCGLYHQYCALLI